MRLAPGLPLVIFDQEPWAPYDRVNLVGVLRGDLNWADLDNTFPTLEGSQVVLNHNLIVAINRDTHTVTDLQGQHQAYSILVLATGSQVCLPNLPGAHLKGIYTFHQRSDVEQLLNRRKDSRRIAVLGGGVLGLEIACALYRDGTEVCIVQPERLMVRQLDARASSMVLEQMHALGIPVMLDRAKEILGKDTVTGLRTYSGEVLECDTIVLATGVQPIVELAVGAGLRVGRGIKVNDRMQNSDPAIYAVGECAEHRGRVYGLVGPGYEQAAVAVQNMVGNRATYNGSVAVTLLKGIDLTVVTIGRMEVDLPSPKGVIYKQAKDKVYRKLMLHRGRLIGIQAIGDWPELWRVQAAVRRKQWLGPWQRQRFRTTGSLWPERSLPPVSEWPAQATVCNCKGITRGILSQAVQAGSGTVKALQEQTGAGTVCGSCKPLLAQLVGREAAIEPVAGEKTLVGACCAALLLVLGITLSPPFAPSDSVLGYWHPEVLWLDSFWKQVSGYSLLALSLVALTLSLRKRWQRFSFASFGRWRLLHGLVGVVTLGILIVHTGFNLGRSPLNFLLMMCFLGVNLSGAIAAGMTVSEGRSLSPAVRKWRAQWVWYHTLLFWPLPILLAFHILAWVSEGWAYAKQILMFPQGLSEVGRERRVPTLRESMAGSLGLV